MNSPVRKVVIPVAGYGTRFLPATKAMPKEMLPIIDKPVIQYVVEEAVAAGITEVILVTSGTKRPVEDHFDENRDLEAWLNLQGKVDALREVKAISSMANFVYVRQKGPYGNATPVMNVRHLIGDEPFIVMFGDEIFSGKKSRIRQLIEAYEKYGDPVLTVLKTDDAGTKRYGIIDPAAEVQKGIFQVNGIVEKPGPDKAPSRLAAIGSYLLTSDIFDELPHIKPSLGGEYFLIDGINALLKKRAGYACEINGEYFDTGSKIGWLRANIAMALKRPDLAEEVQSMLKSMR